MHEDVAKTPLEPHHELRFEGGRLVPSRNLLELEGESIRLEPQVAEVLACLMSSGGQVLSKEEVFRQVWEGRAVSDDTLVVAIYELRKALGDNARHPTFIETIPRRGYRWLPHVEIGPLPNPATPSAEIPQDPDRAPIPRQSFSQSRKPVVWAAALGATILLILGLFAFQPWASEQAAEGGETSREGFSRSTVPDLVPDLEPHPRSLYLTAVQLLGRRSSQDLQRAEKLLEQVVVLAPNLAAGHAALAQTYVHMADRGLGDRLSLYFQGRTAAEKALELDPHQARAHVALAMVALIFDWDATATEASLARARAIEPDHADAFQILAWLRSAQDRGEEAAAAARRAIEIDPVAPSRYSDLAFVLTISGRPEEALAVLDRALELDPDLVGGHAARFSANLLLNRLEAAVLAHLEALRLSGTRESFRQDLEGRYQQGGMDGYLRHYLDHLPEDRALVVEASLLALLGDTEDALDRLERAADRRNTEILWAPFYPELASLHGEPRFQALVQRVSLADPAALQTPEL